MTYETVPDSEEFAESAPQRSFVERFGNLDTVLALASSVLLPIGVISILLGWYGAAHTPNVFEQIPYLISGGLIGVALVCGAGLLYFGSWVTRTVREQRTTSGELLAVMQDIRDELRARPVSVPAVPARRGRRAMTNGALGGYVATATGSMLHRPDCTVVAGRGDLHEVDPATSAMGPCRLCDPLAQAERPAHA